MGVGHLVTQTKRPSSILFLSILKYPLKSTGSGLLLVVFPHLGQITGVVIGVKCIFKYTISMTRRSFLALTASSAISAATKPLNVIFILIDDLGWKDFSCYGNTFHETPHVDALASDGMRFTNAYAACCVCSPTRAAVLTGKYPARLQLTDWIPGRKQWPASKLLRVEFKQELPHAEITIAEMLKPLGYATLSAGKWHLGGEGFGPESQGFDENVAGTFKGSPDSYFGPYNLPGLSGLTKDDFLTNVLTERAEQFIEQSSKSSKPFFVYLPHFAVHLPLGAQQKVIERYKARLKPGQDPKDATYAAMVEGVDTAVGHLRKRLADLGLADNTVIFFTSDNGGLRHEGKSTWPTTDNSPLRAGKGHQYEGGLRVPLLVHWPGVTKPASTNATPVISIDFFPTIAELTGAKFAHKVDGVSLAPLLRGATALKREAIFWHYPHYSNQGGVPTGAVRQGDWKLIEFFEDGRVELFNLKDDPGETRNLSKREAGRAAALKKRLAAWRKSVAAVMPKPNPEYDPAKADQGLAGAEQPIPPS